MQLTRLVESDLSSILEWRNSPHVRNYMFCSREIAVAEHLEWFQHLQNDNSRLWYVCRDEKGCGVGVVYFTSINYSSAVGFWGFYTKPDAQPGTGTRMGVAAINLAFETLMFNKLNAEVLSTNIRSLRYHLKLGFKEEGRFRDEHFNGVAHCDVLRLCLFSKDWLAGSKNN